MNGLAKTAGIATIAMLAGAAGFVGYRLLPSNQTSITRDSGETVSPEKQKATLQPRVSPIASVVPEYSLVNLAGQPTSVRSFDHPILIYNFWATWCAPCVREIPLLNQLRQDRRRQGVEVIGIAVDFREAVQNYLQKTTIDYPLLMGEQDGLDALDAFGIPSAFPVSVFADKDKRIVAVKLGELHADEAAFILDRVAELNAKSIDLAAAKQQIADKLRQFAVDRAKHDSSATGAALQQLDRD